MKRARHNDSNGDVSGEVTTAANVEHGAEERGDATREFSELSRLASDYVERCSSLGRLEELETAQMLANRRICELEREIQLRQSLDYEHCLLREVSNARKIQRENIELRKKLRSMRDCSNELEIQLLGDRLKSVERKASTLEEELRKCEKLKQFENFLSAGFTAPELKQRLKVYDSVSETLDDMRLTLDVSEQSLIVVRSRLEKTQRELRIAEAERDQALDSARVLEKAFDALRSSQSTDPTTKDGCISELLDEVRNEFQRIRQYREQILCSAQEYSPVVTRAVNTSPPPLPEKDGTEDDVRHVTTCERAVQAEAVDTTIPPVTHNWHKVMYDLLQLRDREWQNLLKSITGIKEINITKHSAQVITAEGEEILLEKSAQGAVLNVLSNGCTLKQFQERLREHLTRETVL